MSTNPAYFDYAAATPMSEAVIQVMQPYFADKFYNPSALYLAAQEIGRAIAGARSEVAQVLGSKTSEIIFTAGGTESCNLAISGIMRQFPGKNCVISAIEHDAIMESAKRYAHHLAPVAPDGRVDLASLAGLIGEDTVLVSIMYANNEIGTIQPLREVTGLIRRIRKQRQSSGNATPLYFHTDACQAPNYLPLLVNSLGVDLMTLNGGKIYGPKQSGILYVNSSVKIAPLVMGGGQERGIRSGTENVAAIIGFSKALQDASINHQAEAERLATLRDGFIKKVLSDLPNASLNGSSQYRLANNIHLTLKGCDNERLMMELDGQGFMVATGSACSASSDQPSHVLEAIGLGDDLARSSLRITLGQQTSRQQLDELATSLAALVA